MVAGGIAPPAALEDWYLFELFGRNKTLEEIDAIDIGRISRAVEAGAIAAHYRTAIKLKGAARLKERSFIDRIRREAIEWRKTQ